MLAGPLVVTKRGKLTGSKLTLNPDLVFDQVAVGDVKPKADWLASDRCVVDGAPGSGSESGEDRHGRGLKAGRKSLFRE